MNTNPPSRRKQRAVALIAELVELLMSDDAEPAAPPVATRLLTTSEVCDLLGCSEPTLRKHVRAGRVPALRMGDVLRFDRGEVLAAMSKNAPVEEPPVRLVRGAR